VQVPGRHGRSVIAPLAKLRSDAAGVVMGCCTRLRGVTCLPTVKMVGSLKTQSLSAKLKTENENALIADFCAGKRDDVKLNSVAVRVGDGLVSSWRESAVGGVDERALGSRANTAPAAFWNGSTVVEDVADVREGTCCD